MISSKTENVFYLVTKAGENMTTPTDLKPTWYLISPLGLNDTLWLPNNCLTTKDFSKEDIFFSGILLWF